MDTFKENSMGERIRNLRLRLGMSMAEFGHHVGYSPTHIASLEKAIRAEMGLSQRAFANMSGLNNSLISEVEAGNRELNISAEKKDRGRMRHRI